MPRCRLLSPLAEISEYQFRLKALTGGEGAYAMELSHYAPSLLAGINNTMATEG